MKNYNIAIVGATGLVGSTFLKIIDEYNISFNNIKLFASLKSKGKKITFKNKEYSLNILEDGCFKNIDFVLFSAGGAVSKQYAKQAVSEGAIVIDNSSAFRMDENVPLVVPEVNMSDAYQKNLIANPNCSTIQCVVPLYVLDNNFGIESIEYNTYQAVSGAGIKGINDLVSSNGKFEKHFPYDIKETCIPHIDMFMEDGYTKEEHKMMNETRKILHNDNILISATCVRVPVLNSHAVSIRVVLKNDFTVDAIRNIMKSTKGIVVLDEPENNIYPTSIQANGNDNIFVGRIRKDKVNKKAVLLYVVSDNIRKGAASNTVQIMKGIMDYENSI
ncbi:MAG: aspartate-semialdehyde dehydrogenase [Bacilli bacterium]|jgi:aspartate-semialdehyde dehydrogenase|nr:aspartate-semialdehyde dehydrogenase [Bacilli bacterium]MDD2681896.1 aspartate-semialdehyde dehydrogenase [Bacilli bacterium]MDD3121170.1 aspartate-semialdehyde dehydrogenase [Bacilli bacterium]MDD4063334.1 aspartate-semialdehyde dehydrogenase [Bacilli bacterium]MDD4482611.1 aspartate-semialdehyde dehydrogenase [Bacilli bacterium]